MSALASLITGLRIVYSTVYSGTNERKHNIRAEIVSIWWHHHVAWCLRWTDHSYNVESTITALWHQANSSNGPQSSSNGSSYYEFHGDSISPMWSRQIIYITNPISFNFEKLEFITTQNQFDELSKWNKERPYQVWPCSEKNCTHESGNRLSGSK